MSRRQNSIMSNGTDICSRLIIVFMNYYCSSRLKKRWRHSQLIVPSVKKTQFHFPRKHFGGREKFHKTAHFSHKCWAYLQNELLISAMKLYFQAPTINSHLTNYSLYQNSNTSSWCARESKKNASRGKIKNRTSEAPGSTFISYKFALPKLHTYKHLQRATAAAPKSVIVW